MTLPACWTDDGFEPLRGQALAAPPLMWSEVRSSLHEGVWRRDVDAAVGTAALDRLERAPVEPVSYARLGHDAWAIADALGWAKTYDAEYLALARHLGGRVVTLDRRLRAGADRTGLVVFPAEL